MKDLNIICSWQNYFRDIRLKEVTDPKFCFTICYNCHFNTVPGMSCPEGYQQSENRCYKIHQKTDTWFGARSTCLKKGSDLVTFENGVPSPIRDYPHNGEYWIGLQRERWLWINNGSRKRICIILYR